MFGYAKRDIPGAIKGHGDVSFLTFLKKWVKKKKVKSL